MPDLTALITLKGTRVANVKTWVPSGPVTTDYYTTYSLGKNSSGGSNPNWRDTIARGGNATQNYDMMVVSLAPGGVSCTAQPNSPGDSVTFNGHIGGAIQTTLDTVLVQKLIGEATVTALKRVRSGFSAGTTTGELGEAIAMLRNPANGLRKLTSSYISRAQVYRKEFFRKGMSNKALRDVHRALPDLYLEFQFGWKPLAGDIASGIDAIARAANNPKRIRFSGTARQEVTQPKIDIGGFNNFPTSNYRLRINRSVKALYRARVAGSASLKLGFGMPAFQAGSTIPDMIPTIWNLAPWSFLIDYFSNVGEVLEARATSQLLSMTYGCTSVLADITSEFTVGFVDSTPDTTTGRCVHFQRRKLSAGFNVPPIKFDERPSKGQSMNIAALVAAKLIDKGITDRVPKPSNY